jgi:hypothetical protein
MNRGRGIPQWHGACCMAVRRLSHRDASYGSATAHGSGAATRIHRDKPASVTTRHTPHEPTTHPSMSAGRLPPSSGDIDRSHWRT